LPPYERARFRDRPLCNDLVEAAGREPGQGDVAGAWYNFACGAALAGHRDEAPEYLRHAIDRGYTNADHMAKDEDLTSLRDYPKFQELLASAGKNPASAAPAASR
jgi:hypothetical protein